MLATLTNVKQAPGMLPTDDYYNKIQTFTWNEFIYTKIIHSNLHSCQIRTVSQLYQKIKGKKPHIVEVLCISIIQFTTKTLIKYPALCMP